MPKLRSTFTVSLLVLALIVTGCGSGGAGETSDEAAEAYASAKEALDRRNGRADADAAVAGFEAAVQSDPDFAAAWAGLAQARMWLEFNQGVPDQLARAESAAERAVELAPDAMDTHLALGYIAYWGHRDLDGALGHFQAAEAVAPDNAEVAGAIGNIYRRKGQLDEAIVAYERRVAIDPSIGQGQTTLAGTYNAVGRYADGREVGNDLVAMGDGRGHVWRFWAAYHSGDTATAWSEIPEIQEAQGRAGQPGYFTFLQAMARRDVAAADGLIDQIGTDGIGLNLRDAMAIHMARTGQVAAHADAFDGWIAAAANGLVDEPSDDQERYRQAVRLSDMAFLEALRGNGEVSMAHAAAVVELDPMSVDAWGGSGAMNDVAAAHMALGHFNPALAGLETLTAQRMGPSAVWMQLNPLFDDVRDNPRFQAIVQQRRDMEQPVS